MFTPIWRFLGSETSVNQTQGGVMVKKKKAAKKKVAKKKVAKKKVASKKKKK